MTTDVPFSAALCKRATFLAFFALLLAQLSACSVNPATGSQQFTALMSPAQEMKIGSAEHQKIVKTFGVLPANDPLQVYVDSIGQKVAKGTERADVNYKFFVLDSPVVNAFAVPGGYIYISRGLVAQANSEAEIASVIAHEIGHITGRHSAERYSHGVVTSLGAVLLSAALDDPTASRALGLGSNLYMSSYSRGQESQADDLGIRYAHRAGYSPQAMADFLDNLDGHSRLESALKGRDDANPAASYFSTHPKTEDRVAQAMTMAAKYPPNENIVRRNEYLQRIEGLIYGDSARHGFVRGRDFYHTEMGFAFSVPEGFTIINQPDQVVATSRSGAVIVFDAVPNKSRADALSYLTSEWMKGETVQKPERIKVNGMNAATAGFAGKVGRSNATIRVMAIEWSPGMFFRFQIAIPQGADTRLVEDIKRSTYSLRTLSEAEKSSLRPYTLRLVTARPGDTVSNLAQRMAYEDYREERFRALNALKPGEPLDPGAVYKIVAER